MTGMPLLGAIIGNALDDALNSLFDRIALQPVGLHADIRAQRIPRMLVALRYRAAASAVGELATAGAKACQSQLDIVVHPPDRAHGLRSSNVPIHALKP